MKLILNNYSFSLLESGYIWMSTLLLFHCLSFPIFLLVYLGFWWNGFFLVSLSVIICSLFCSVSLTYMDTLVCKIPRISTTYIFSNLLKACLLKEAVPFLPKFQLKVHMRPCRNPKHWNNFMNCYHYPYDKPDHKLSISQCKGCQSLIFWFWLVENCLIWTWL